MVVTSAQNDVSIAITSISNGAMLLGTRTTTPVAGVATFTNLSVDRPGDGYMLFATYPSPGGMVVGFSRSFDMVLTLTAVNGGGAHTCGVTGSGKAYCWGYNGVGQLGDGTTANQTVAVPVATAVRFAAVWGGYDHTCGVTAVGTPYCWGYNGFGAVGNGQPTNYEVTPVPVYGGFAFATISMGSASACALTPAGVAYCWGANHYGQMGDGTTVHRASPMAVAGNLTFSTVVQGGGHACGVTTAGATYCWGLNYRGELGDGTTTNSLTPVPVSGGLSFTTLAARSASTCGLTTAGAAYCWGDNMYGQLGDGTTTDQTAPTPVVGHLSFVAITTGGQNTCGLTPAGVAYCWGWNGYGQLGDGTTTDRTTPTAVLGGLSFVSITAAFRWHTCGLTNTGAVYCWGDNFAGELGDGTTAERHAPVRIIQ